MGACRAVCAVLILGVLALAAGCASGSVERINSRITSPEVITKKPPDATYTVDPPDSIRIEFINEPELTREAQVRTDGCVTLPYVVDVKVAGMTTTEISAKLEDLYGKYYKEPKLLVTVTAYRSKHIYVYGEVRSPGMFPYTGSQTVADAIGGAGGLTRRCAPGRVKVVRGDIENPERYKVNLSRLILKGDLRQDVSLAENDVVYVPPSALAWVGYQIESVLFPFQSVLSLMSTAQTVGGTTGQ